jgi:hypothetical protein
MRGARPGERRGGRKRGTPNKRTAERETAIREAAAQIAGMIEGAFEGDSHALLVAIYKDPKRPIELRLEAAKAAIAYERPKLASIEHFGKDGAALAGPSVVVTIAGQPIAPPS